MKRSIKENFFYNTLYLVINIAFPLITTPYVSRVLGVAKVGDVSFGLSFVNWFILLASLGIPVYGMREVAKARDDRERLNKVFSEILTLHFTVVFIFLVLYFIMVFLIPAFYLHRVILSVYSINLLLSFLSLDWFYYGIEEYEYIAKRSLIVKLMALLLIFLLIKEEKDFILYVIITVFALSFNNILNLLHSGNYIRYHFSLRPALRHIFAGKFFYLQVIIGSIYTVADQVLLGLLSSNVELGFYSRGRQLSTIIITCILSFVRTISPRLSNLYYHDREEYKKLVTISFRLTSFLIFPAAAGVFFLSDSLMYAFGGKEFIAAGSSMSILSVLIMASVFAVFFDSQVSVPSHHEKNTLIGNTGVAALCLLLNFFLIRKYGSTGASISVVIAETTGVLIQLFLIKKEKLFLEFIDYNIFKYIISALVMSVCLFFLNIYLKEQYLLKIFIMTPAGITVYCAGIFIICRITGFEDNEIVYIYKKLKLRSIFKK